MQQTTIRCGGWCFLWHYFCGIWCSTGFSSGAFTVSYFYQPCLLPDTYWWIQADNVRRRHPSLQTNQSIWGLYSGLQTDIDAIQDCISISYLTINPHKCKYLICSRYTPSTSFRTLILGGVTLEQVESYHYLGVLVSSRLTWCDYIEHICVKARKLVGMLYRQFYSCMSWLYHPAA